MANDFSALCRNEGTGQRACHPQRIDDPGFGIIAERHGLERGVGKGVDRGPVVGALQSNLLVDEPVANLSVQPTERPRSPRPWWLLRRVSLDRDAQQVPAFSDMALQYRSCEQTQGFRAVRLGSIMPPGRFTSGRWRRCPRNDIRRTRPPGCRVASAATSISGRRTLVSTELSKRPPGAESLAAGEGEMLSDLFVGLAVELRQRIAAFNPTHVFFIADVGHGPIVDCGCQASDRDVHVVELGRLRVSGAICDIEHGTRAGSAGAPSNAWRRSIPSDIGFALGERESVGRHRGPGNEGDTPRQPA